MKKTILGLIIAAAAAPAVRAQTCSDKQATPQTAHLFTNLYKLEKKGVLFGHQDALAYGVEWKYQPGKSDVKAVTGDYPALYGWELGHIEQGASVNLDTVPFDKMRGFIQQGYGRGGVITISWHGNNPINNKSAWDVTPGGVAAVLPGGEKNAMFLNWLNYIADFLGSLKGNNGEAIPVLFRPFHELTGGWFWWGKNSCTPEQFKALFRYTVTYLREEKKLHNLIYVYNTTQFKTREEFLERYPGDDVVDVLSFDAYQNNVDQKQQFIEEVGQSLSILDTLAVQKHKLTAIAEIGFDRVPDATWWTGTLHKVLEKHPVSYVLAWRNAGIIGDAKQASYFVPYSSAQASSADFVQFYKAPDTFFEKDAAQFHLYGN